MEIRRVDHGLVTTLCPVGPLVEEELTSVREEVAKCAERRPTRMVLDMSMVPFMDSVALEWLQGLPAELSRRGGEVRVASLNEICRDIFKATRLGHFISVSQNTEGAVRSLL